MNRYFSGNVSDLKVEQNIDLIVFKFITGFTIRRHS